MVPMERTERLGHSTREMFDRCNTVDREDTRAAVNQLEVFFRNVTQTEPDAEIAENSHSRIASYSLSGVVTSTPSASPLDRRGKMAR